MASRAGDGSPQEPVDRRLPLKTVCFREPTSIPGCGIMLTTLEAGVRRVVDGRDWLPPPLWLDRENRVIKIEGRCYPLERVHYYEQATAAITKKPPPLNLEKYTIGKRTAI